MTTVPPTDGRTVCKVSLMRDVRIYEGEPAFPAFGARARVWGRFERDLQDWLATPEGRFAAWRAAATVPPVARPEDED